METKLRITGNWDELKAKLKQQNPSLTDTDLSFSAGQEDELVIRLSKKLDKTQDEIVDMIDDLQSKSQERESGQREGAERESSQTEKEEEKSKNY